MPRPKVPLHQRQRAAEACSLCREAKKKCSGVAPCAYCLRRGNGASCVMTSSRRRSVNRVDHALLSMSTCSTQQVPSYSESQSVGSGGGEGGVVTPTVPHQGLHPISPSESAATDCDVGGILPREPSPRMLRSLRGERVYIGQGASLSFLQLIRRVVADQIGPSQFSHNEHSDTMLEKESPDVSIISPSLNDIVEVELEQKIAYAKTYHSLTQGLIDILDPSEIELLLRNIPQGTTTSAQQQTTLNLVIAIGAQGDTLSPCSRNVSLIYFRHAQRHAFSSMLEDPSLDMVRTFLLMAFYLLGECRRNTAFIYLGIATRAAVALGLHSRDSYVDMTDCKDQLRLRVWMSLRILDMLANAILGRPAATAGVRSDMKPILDTITTSKTNLWVYLIASYNIASIINRVVDKIYEKKEISIPAVEQLLQEIDTWSKEFPQSLGVLSMQELGNTSSTSSSNGLLPSVQGEAGEASGKVHVSCLYYFAVTLVTRPILVSTLTTAQSTGGLGHAHLSAACLDAAMFLVQTCVEAHRANLLHRNMCILKALIFPAGLILGFEIFAKKTTDYAIETAFHGSREVLGFLATQSPQAAHYYDILTSLSNAIAERRSRVDSSGKSRYVSKLFTFDVGERSMGGGRGFTGSLGGVIATNQQHQQQHQQPGNLTSEWPAGDGMDLFMDWESLNISLWDSFPHNS